MFGRRVPPNVVFLLSLLLAVVCGFISYQAYASDRLVGALIAGAFAVWFTVDAVRSYSWTRQSVPAPKSKQSE